MATAPETSLAPEQNPDTTTKVALLLNKTTPSETVDQSITVRRSTGLDQGTAWLQTNLRGLIALALTVLVCWLAFNKDEHAVTALIAAFSVLMGALWGERAALKVPGQDS